MEAIKLIKEQYPTVNIFDAYFSGNMPSTPRPIEKALNAASIILAASAGLNAVIIEPLDTDIRAAVFASDALLMRDPTGRDFEKAYKNGVFAGVRCSACGRSSFREKRECQYCKGDTRPELNCLDVIKNEIVRRGVCPACSFNGVKSDGFIKYGPKRMVCATCRFNLSDFAETIETTCEKGCDSGSKFTEICFTCIKNPIRRYGFMTFFGYADEMNNICTYFGPNGPRPSPFLLCPTPPPEPDLIKKADEGGTASATGWSCPSCEHSVLAGKFCPECGSAKP